MRKKESKSKDSSRSKPRRTSGGSRVTSKTKKYSHKADDVEFDVDPDTQPSDAGIAFLIRGYKTSGY